MHVLLLSGGSGKRLWPLSNDVRSKQFIRLLPNERNGEYESMICRVYRQIKEVDAGASVTVAAPESQVSAILNQLGKHVDISVEPCRRDTFGAIALATAYLHDIKKLGREDAVIVCPVDPYVDISYFQGLLTLDKLSSEGTSNLTLMGINPTFPSEKYGYIIPETHESVSNVVAFKEKPDGQTAKQYIADGAVWNAGVFAFRIGYLLDKAYEITGYDDYHSLFAHYASLPKISFDYAVVEKEPSVQVLRFGGEWKDIGTWNTFTESMSERVIGQGIIGDACENVYIVNELQMPVLAMGLQNVVIAASSEGILVSDKDESARIKPYVDSIGQQVFYAEKSWGIYHVLAVTDESMTVRLTINAGSEMSYHRHQKRQEIWTVLSGEGEIITDGHVKKVKTGDTVSIPEGQLHTVKACSRMELIEIQLGKDISADDKEILG